MKKDYKELYERITNSDWFKKAYHNKSLGECPIVVEELEESEDEKIRKEMIEYFRWNSQQLLNEHTNKEVLSYLEKQKEQKLIEWSDSFEENIRILLHDKLTWHSEDGSMSSTTLIDDKTLRDIVNGIWFYVGKETLKHRMKNKIHIQPKQESCNYITPHKKFFQWIHDRLVHVYNEDPDVDYMQSFKKRIEELSFNESNWKPSEEQMNALKYFIKLWGKTDTQLEYTKVFNNVKSLYEQLKKL